MTEKYYQIGTHTEADWDSLHSELEQEGAGIVSRCVECADDKLHSPTRGTYLLTDEEAQSLKPDPRVKFINIDYSKYPEIYKPPAEELQATTPDLINRYSAPVKNYRRVSGLSQSDINRTGYQLLRCQQKLDPWVEGEYTDTFVIESNISQWATGKDIDVIVADDGMWFGHPEFQNNARTVLTDEPVESPVGYVGGNVLPGNGTCDLLDLVLDAPYYLDPDWFNASPGTRLTTRWDGTVVPVETEALNWWALSSNRSAQFSSAGVVDIRANGYTRARNNGSNTALSSVGNHGTPCCALTYGRTQGWAYNANKWAFNLYNTYGTDIEQGFDIVKIFHQLKPVNTQYGNKNPTVMSNSWGYRASKGTTNGYYHFRNDDPVQYPGTASEPAFISHMGATGDAGRWKSEMKLNSLTTALDELIDSGVVFVCAAGNSNQKQVNWGHPDFNNYISATSDQALEDTSYLEFGVEVTGTTNRRGFPQQGGKTVNGITGEVTYKTINIGALDDNYNSNKETKVNYSDRGEGIDVYAPADGTLAANRGYSSVGTRPDTYTGLTVTPTDALFSGTSAACPVAAGFIATILEFNRSWNYQDIKDWLNRLDVQDETDFYYGIESTSATDANWFDYRSLEGGDARVIYQGGLVIPIPATFRLSGRFRLSGGLSVKFRT